MPHSNGLIMTENKEKWPRELLAQDEYIRVVKVTPVKDGVKGQPFLTFGLRKGFGPYTSKVTRDYGAGLSFGLRTTDEPEQVEAAMERLKQVVVAAIAKGEVAGIALPDWEAQSEQPTGDINSLLGL